MRYTVTYTSQTGEVLARTVTSFRLACAWAAFVSRFGTDVVVWLGLQAGGERVEVPND